MTKAKNLRWKKKKDEIADEVEEGVTALSDNSIGTTRYTSLLDIACADSDTYFEKMKTSLQNGESISFASLIEESGGTLDNIDQDLFDITKVSGYDDIDFDTVNMGYSNAVASLSDVYSSIDMTGMSQGCLELFNNTYGNLIDELQLDEPTLPDGFSMDAIMSSAESAVSDAYSSAISSGDFATVRSQVSLSDVMSLMNQAAQGAESYSLTTSYSELQSQAKANGKNAYTDVRGTYSVDNSAVKKSVEDAADAAGADDLVIDPDEVQKNIQYHDDYVNSASESVKKTWQHRAAGLGGSEYKDEESSGRKNNISGSDKHN